MLSAYQLPFGQNLTKRYLISSYKLTYNLRFAISSDGIFLQIQAPAAKRKRVNPGSENIPSTRSSSSSLKGSNSTGSLGSAAAGKLMTNRSGSNLRAGQSAAATVKGKNTATVKPSVINGRPVSSAGNYL